MTFRLLVAAADSRKINQVKQAFDHCDCQVIPAPSMSLALFLAQKNLPDIIIADQELTDGDGLSFLHEIKAEKELSSIPFVFYVSHNSEEQLRENARNGGSAAIIDERLNDTALYDFIMPIIQCRLASKGERILDTPE